MHEILQNRINANSDTQEPCETILKSALDIGEAMLKCGAESFKVENSIAHICSTYFEGNIHVFSISSLIIVSWYANKKNYTQARRIYGSSIRLDLIESLSLLEKDVCKKRPAPEEIEKELIRIMQNQKIGKTTQFLGYLLAASSFTLFWGGDFLDAIAAAIVSCFLYGMDYLSQKLFINRLVYLIVSSWLVGVLAIFFVRMGLGHHEQQIMIGNIMLLIPGIGITTAFRDMMCGDIITGLLSFFESILMAIAIAGGFALAMWMV